MLDNIAFRNFVSKLTRGCCIEVQLPHGATRTRHLKLQVEEIRTLRGRKGHTEIVARRLGTAELHRFSWRDESIRSIAVIPTPKG
jgi:hypothetical protein